MIIDKIEKNLEKSGSNTGNRMRKVSNQITCYKIKPTYWFLCEHFNAILKDSNARR